MNETTCEIPVENLDKVSILMISGLDRLSWENIMKCTEEKQKTFTWKIL